MEYHYQSCVQRSKTQIKPDLNFVWSVALVKPFYLCLPPFAYLIFVTDSLLKHSVAVVPSVLSSLIRMVTVWASHTCFMSLLKWGFCGFGRFVNAPICSVRVAGPWSSSCHPFCCPQMREFWDKVRIFPSLLPIPLFPVTVCITHHKTHFSLMQPDCLCSRNWHFSEGLEFTEIHLGQKMDKSCGKLLLTNAWYYRKP